MEEIDEQTQYQYEDINFNVTLIPTWTKNRIFYFTTWCKENDEASRIQRHKENMQQLKTFFTDCFKGD